MQFAAFATQHPDFFFFCTNEAPFVHFFVVSNFGFWEFSVFSENYVEAEQENCYADDDQGEQEDGFDHKVTHLLGSNNGFSDTFNIGGSWRALKREALRKRTMRSTMAGSAPS